MALWSIICVTGNGNVKEACEALVWDMVDTGLQVHWEDHQSAKSSVQIMLINVPLVLDRGGVEGEIIWHLTEIEKALLKKGGSSIRVCWRKAIQDNSDLATEQTGEREEQGRKGPFSQQVTHLSRKRMSALYSGGHG
jgi:hypothetical protein